jgi:hypothetical protein
MGGKMQQLTMIGQRIGKNKSKTPHTQRQHQQNQFVFKTIFIFHSCIIQSGKNEIRAK